MRMGEIDYFGGCPECGTNDGYLNVGREHWFVCDKHKTKWWIGSNLFSSWMEETEEEWQRNKIKLADYREVEPIHDKEVHTNEEIAGRKPLTISVAADHKDFYRSKLDETLKFLKAIRRKLDNNEDILPDVSANDAVVGKIKEFLSDIYKELQEVDYIIDNKYFMPGGKETNVPLI